MNYYVLHRSNVYQYGNILNAAIHKIRANLQRDHDGKYLPDIHRSTINKPHRPWWRPTYTSADIETTAYALLTIKHDIVESMLLVRWLTNRKNAFGGWYSTQNTVVSLRALSTFATLFGHTYRSKHQLV